MWQCDVNRTAETLKGGTELPELMPTLAVGSEPNRGNIKTTKGRSLPKEERSHEGAMGLKNFTEAEKVLQKS